jgi:glycosyltransferase involved in cell wall biosynthesis
MTAPKNKSTTPPTSASEKIRVVLISTFGPNVRGISPYADGLKKGLIELNELAITAIDYIKLYPDFLYPTSGNAGADNHYAVIHYAKPSTWAKVIKLRPDIIHLQYWSPITAIIHLYIAIAAAKNGIKTVLTVHNPLPHEKISIFSPIERLLVQKVDRIIVHTPNATEILNSKYKKIEKKIHVIAHGVDITKENNQVKLTDADYHALNLDPKNRYILYFGNIRHYKGVDILLSAWEKIASQHPSTYLIIAGRTWGGEKLLSKLVGKLLGNHNTEAHIENMAKKKSPTQTLYKLAFIEEAELTQLIKIAKLCVFPYRKFNAQSGAATKAAALGTPIITSSQGGLPSLAIDNTFICADLNAQNLAQIIDDKLNSLSAFDIEKQKNKVIDISWSSIARNHYQVYQNLAESQ